MRRSSGGCGELLGAQRCEDLLGPGIDVALSPRMFECPADLGQAQMLALVGAGSAPQNGQGITVCQVVERLQGGWVVLAQGRAQRICMPGTGPDQVLVSSGQDLDRLGLCAVARQRAVIVPVSADQIGEQLGIAGIGFRAGDLMAVAVAGHGQWVDRRLSAELRTDEQRHRIAQSREPDEGFVAAVYRWATTGDLAAALDASDIGRTGSPMSAGDFVRWCRQVLDLADQVRNAAATPELRAVAKRAITDVRRGVVAVDAG